MLAAGSALCGLALTSTLSVAMILAGTLTLTALVYQLTTVTVLQALPPPRMRGRVLALAEVIRLGLVPPGGFVASLLVAGIGVSTAFVLYGALAIVAVVAVVVLCRPLLALKAQPPERADPVVVLEPE